MKHGHQPTPSDQPRGEPPTVGSGVKPPPAKNDGSPSAPPPMQYMVVSDRWDGEGEEPYGRVGELLTFLAADRGWEVVAVTGPYADDQTKYLMARRRPDPAIAQPMMLCGYCEHFFDPSDKRSHIPNPRYSPSCPACSMERLSTS